MSEPTLNELASETERQFQAALGSRFNIASRKVDDESGFRNGFRLVFIAASSRLEVSYSDLEFEVILNGHELFGHGFHEDFGGNMFSREHLKQYLSDIVTHSVCKMQVVG